MKKLFIAALMALAAGCAHARDLTIGRSGDTFTDIVHPDDFTDTPGVVKPPGVKYDPEHNARDRQRGTVFPLRDVILNGRQYRK